MVTPESDPDSELLSDDLVSTIAGLLGIEEFEIRARPESTFIQLGGDSVRALQLTFQLDSLELELDLESVLDQGNSLQKLSDIISPCKDDVNPNVNRGDKGETNGYLSPFSLLPEQEVEQTIREACQQIGCPKSNIDDILPTTSQQKLLWLASLQQPGTYIAHWTFRLPDGLDLAQLKRAWGEVLEETPVLRARFILDSTNQLRQAMVAIEDINEIWTEKSTAPASLVEADHGKALAGFAIEKHDSKELLHIFAHHALYDRWSMQLVFDDLRRKYSKATSCPLRPSFLPYLEPLVGHERDTLLEKWRTFTGDGFLTPVPNLDTVDTPGGEIETVNMSASLASSYYTKAELVTAAWSWVCSRQYNSSELSFGLTLWGRDLPVKSASEMVFPTFHTLPVCVRLQPSDSLTNFLGNIKTTLGTLRSIQSLSLDEIAAISDVSRQACQFNSIVVVQPEGTSSANSGSSVLDMKDLASFDLRQGHPCMLECTPNNDKITICLTFNPSRLAPEIAKPLLSRFCMAMEMLSSGGAILCTEMDLFTDEDERRIKEWTRPHEPRRTEKMYSMIQECAEVSPDSIALWTTESTVTYGELMRSAKNFAHMLRKNGAAGHIGACFERSSLAVIAQIGICMAGCAFVPMEPSNPPDRLKQIVVNSDMSLLVCSGTLSSKVKDFDVPIMVPDQEELFRQDVPHNDEPEIAPEALKTAYIIFTSGSTGTPKGVIIQHEQIATSLSAQKNFFKVRPGTRTLQFSSLAFDMSVHEIYMTLSAGGTVCIPTDAERFELEDFLARAETNYSMLTPSVASTLSQNSFARIKDISLCGEPISKGLVERVLQAGSAPWIVYGPTETTVVDLGHKAEASTSRFNLGFSFAATAWIVDADDHDKLAPVSVPGELAFSGYTLAAGYYKDKEKTVAAFPTGLKWTERFEDLVPNQRVYLTGDLASYNSDGTIQFLGRLGGYTKIAGNRVDLDEIRHVLIHDCNLPQVAVVICEVNGEDTSRDMLLCFFVDKEESGTDNCKIMAVTSAAKSKGVAARNTLAQRLPKYMMPSAFIPVSQIPLNTSGKMDAGILRGLIKEFDIETLLSTFGMNEIESDDAVQNGDDEGVAESQRILKDAWAAVLSLPTSSLNTNSHFVRMGGDSLRAMELAAKLRNGGLLLHVADIFQHPVLKDMAKSITQRPTAPEAKPMFTPAEYDKLMDSAVHELQIPQESIESLSMCSSLQIQIMVASEQSRGSFLHRDSFRLPSTEYGDEARHVCHLLVEQNELLRTRMFVDAATGRFIQAVVKSDAAVEVEQVNCTLTQYLESESEPALGLGGPMCRFLLLTDINQGPVLVWEMHHSIYDGHSHVLLLNRLQTLIEQYRVSKTNNEALETATAFSSFQRFVEYLLQVDKDRARDFWSRHLDGSERLALNVLRPAPAQSLTDARAEKVVRAPRKKSAFTSATYLRAAFALLLSRYANSSDVNFAATVNGRDLPVDGIEDIAGPTFATIPVRVKLDQQETVGDLLARIQRESSECASQQTLPVEDIASIDASCKQACQFNVHLLVQSQDQKLRYEAIASLGYKVVEDASPMLLRIPFNLVATSKQDGIDLEVIYNSAAITATEVNLFLDQMDSVMQRLINGGEELSVHELFSLGRMNRDRIMAVQPKDYSDVPPSSTIPQLVFRNLPDRSNEEAIYTSKVSITYRQLYGLSCALVEQIKNTTRKEREVIAFCFEKSPWAIVAQMAIMLAGHSFVPIDPSWPQSRQQNILEQTQAPLIVTSSTLAKTFVGLDVGVLTFDGELCSNAAVNQAEQNMPKPSDIAYVLFTSGSTGAPKGVVVEHGSITTTLQAYAHRLSFTYDTKALLFASFTFDASIMETWSVLAAGGTLCIASDEERVSGLSEFIIQSKADTVGLTPTAAGLLEAEKLVNVKTLLFCGEKCRESDLARWRGHNTRLVNGYGPTEASVNAATNVDFSNTELDDIGTTLGGGLWVVNPDNVDEILPVGSIGELVITGRGLARGYLNAPDLTAKRFVKPKWPAWTNLKGSRAYRTGDLARLDATGRLHYCGRQDGQMKINGVRVEAEEIENAVHNTASGMKEVMAGTFSNNGGFEELAVYFVPDGTTAGLGSDGILPLNHAHPEIIASLDDAARKSLPAAALPTYYIPVSRIPQTTSGKADRQRLAHLTSSLHSSQLSLYRAQREHNDTTRSTTPTVNGIVTPNEQKPLSEEERKIQSLWTSVLRTSKASFTSSTHFIEAGGDSVAAIRLAAMAKSSGLDLPVSAIYANPRLGDMAQALAKGKRLGQRAQSVQTPAAFELLDGIDILSPSIETPSPVAERRKEGRRENDYFGICR